MKSFTNLKKKSTSKANGEIQMLVPISQTMLRKLHAYERLVCSDLSRLAKGFDPRFSTDVLVNFYLLRRCVLALDEGENSGQQLEVHDFRTVNG